MDRGVLGARAPDDRSRVGDRPCTGAFVGACGILLAAGACARPAPSGPAPTRPTPIATASRVAAEPAPASSSALADPQPAPLLGDVGIYPDLSDRVRIQIAPRLRGGPLQIVRFGSGDGARNLVWIAGSAVALAPPGATVTAELPAGAAADADGDSIPDALDVLIGAKRVVAAAAPYRQTYRALHYPGGDVPRDEGVCSDVIVRALRNAGYDLQVLIHEDALASPRAYPGIAKLDSSIDHRRVRNLVPWFSRHWVSLPTDPSDASVPWLPGDIVFLDTLRGPEPDHVGIVSDRETPEGRPLVINSWTDGYRSAEMDILSIAPVTHRFRAPPRSGSRSIAELVPLLGRAGLAIAPEHRQVLLVTTPLWSSSLGRLERYEADAGGGFRAVGASVRVRLGDRGLSSRKREGDHTSPAGVFDLGTAFGTSARAPAGVKWPYRACDDGDRWVDDPSAASYNTWQRADGGESRWGSAERLSMYELAIVVRYNDAPVRPNAGSAIFLHAWRERERPTVGCTALARSDLVTVLSWLRSEARPVLVQVADALEP